MKSNKEIGVNGKVHIAKDQLHAYLNFTHLGIYNILNLMQFLNAIVKYFL